jgi:hypothetical protein
MIRFREWWERNMVVIAMAEAGEHDEAYRLMTSKKPLYKRKKQRPRVESPRLKPSLRV